MSRDVWAVAWKEWKELFAPQGRFRGGLVNFLLILAVFGVAMPWQLGRAWVESPALLFAWAWVPLLMLSNLIVDAVAGERERHTLETLLASRLSDRAILVGKMAAAVGYGLAVLVGSLAVGLVTVNVLFARGALVFYPLSTLVGSAALAVLGATLTTAIGVLVSLRAASVRQASQQMGVAILVVGLGPLLVLRAVSPSDPLALGSVALACAALLDAGLIAIALSRFRRTRLVLD